MEETEHAVKNKKKQKVPAWGIALFSLVTIALSYSVVYRSFVSRHCYNYAAEKSKGASRTVSTRSSGDVSFSHSRVSAEDEFYTVNYEACMNKRGF